MNYNENPYKSSANLLSEKNFHAHCCPFMPMPIGQNLGGYGREWGWTPPLH